MSDISSVASFRIAPTPAAPTPALTSRDDDSISLVSSVAARTPAASVAGDSVKPSSMSDQEIKAHLNQLRKRCPKGWKVFMSNTLKKPYWHNKETGPWDSGFRRFRILELGV